MSLVVQFAMIAHQHSIFSTFRILVNIGIRVTFILSPVQPF